MNSKVDYKMKTKPSLCSLPALCVVVQKRQVHTAARAGPFPDFDSCSKNSERAVTGRETATAAEPKLRRSRTFLHPSSTFKASSEGKCTHYCHTFSHVKMIQKSLRLHSASLLLLAKLRNVLGLIATAFQANGLKHVPFHCQSYEVRRSWYYSRSLSARHIAALIRECISRDVTEQLSPMAFLLVVWLLVGRACNNLHSSATCSAVIAVHRVEEGATRGECGQRTQRQRSQDRRHAQG
jgi:hypothetical protein